VGTSTVVDVAVVSWSGRIDLSSLGDTVAQLDQVLNRPHLQKLVIDLSLIEFMDSLGVGALIGARNRCLEDGRTLVLRGVPEMTRILLRSAGLEHLFTYE
jgi:anti-sigma B factor antagonist